jgi:MFS family permease
MLARALYTCAHGSIAVLIALYLDKLGFGLIRIGLFLSAGVAGSAVFAFITTLVSERVGRRRLLVLFTLLSASAGLALVFTSNYIILLLFAFVGSISGVVGGASGSTQPLEQASLPDTAPPEKTTDLFAIYRIIGLSGVAIGTLAAGLPPIYQKVFGVTEIDSFRIVFIAITLFLLIAAIFYRLLSPAVEAGGTEQKWINPLRLPSRRIIFTLTGLFSLDHFAGSLFMQSLAAYWFYSKFGLTLESLALVFFFSQILAAISLWLAAKLANRIGLINTMVFTHIPSSLFLIAAAFAPAAWLAILFWQLRAFLSMMDVPTRDSYTMSVVQPNERVAMAGIHIVGRSISGTFGPSIATALWQVFSATVPLLGCAILKITYDLSLYFMFRNVKPPQEI